ncbi:MAG: hypothetical protein LBH15_02205, partial [Treponema sp.]|nr:hypothetical protein [Treponema sp.]
MREIALLADDLRLVLPPIIHFRKANSFSAFATAVLFALDAAISDSPAWRSSRRSYEQWADELEVGFSGKL